MKLKSVAVIGTVVGSIVMSGSAMSAQNIEYGTIKNKFKDDQGVETCLRVIPDSNKVVMGECPENKEDVPYRMVEWQAEKLDNGFYRLKNKDRMVQGKDACLRTFKDKNSLEMGDCDAKSDAFDLHSMRMWKINAEGDFNVLKNKYKQDAGKHLCLAANKHDDSVGIDSCDGDNIALKQWSSKLLPYFEGVKSQRVAKVTYMMQDLPASGLDRISFPITIEKAAGKAAFQYNGGFEFVDGNKAKLTLRPTGNGSAFAKFDVYNRNHLPATSESPNCKTSDQGVMCDITVNFTAGHGYNLSAQRDEHNAEIWRGYIEDTVTGEINEIGAWKPEAKSKGVGKASAVSVDYLYPTNTCSAIPQTKVSFGTPVSNDEAVAEFFKPTTVGDCQNRIDLNAEPSASGWNLSLQGK